MRRDYFIAYHILYCAYKPYLIPRFFKYTFEHICYRGFAVCARNAEQMQAVGRVSEPLCAYIGICRVGVFYQNLIFLTRIALDNDRRRAVFYRLGGVFVTVGRGALNANKQIPRLYLP